MTAQIKAWGNGQGIRFSKEFLANLGLRLNEYLQVDVEDNKIILSRTFKHKTLEERAALFDGQVGPYKEFDWGDPVGRELW
ncbi:MAG: AbrB/MazE/SpoVT family DNA-binding domain-containing protein [Lachnospiraceae bacterium]|jgi:antitoxin MazE|nr:AbrB/MazE/SpoVT family DNA-binding domain-containing protein [Lachnospiraceae bacterium]